MTLLQLEEFTNMLETVKESLERWSHKTEFEVTTFENSVRFTLKNDAHAYDVMEDLCDNGWNALMSDAHRNFVVDVNFK